ncbi:hypothetical protein NZ698_05880 [Chryseobacterium sp. PBS4-4]|uniref:Uncharacterized protein n=1 Tax=Chryseobacterium edaphi TaxID=2976532 RepID=A0ABT2W3E0_9FLAO|nr:hypothetical protein [Chryseobacterium edaphi]MCU7616719.1 hypothetical protein [Chryseobacterium edaphi]
MDKKILKQLKSEYEELEIKPSANLWDQIDANLEKGSASLPKSSFSLKWWKYAAVFLLLISLGTLIYYNRDFNTEKTDYIVKQNLKKEVLETEIHSEIIPQGENPIVETVANNFKETDLKVKHNNKNDLVPQKETIKPQILEPVEPKIAMNQPENIIDQPAIVENKMNPVTLDKKKISYISANDLLLGRELDKSRENANMDSRNFGVIHLNKVLPNFGNVTVLGVSVYVDPK